MQKKVQFVKDFKKDDMVNDVFVVKFKKPVDKYKNGFKFELRLGDSSKEIMFKYWGSSDQLEVEELYKSIKKDDFVRVQGRINEWNNNLEISSNSNVTIIPSEEIDLADFIPKSKRDIEEMFSELKKYLDSIQNEDLKKVVNYFLSDEKFVSDFKKSPAAMYKHHGWIGGLLEHTLSVVKISVNAIDIYPQLDKDLVIVGAFIHDIGKIEEFKVGSSIKVSEQGMLLGHISIGLEKLSKILDKIEINSVIKLKLKHILLSHHGNLEYGSPKIPAFPEAMLIYHADNLDAKLNLMIRTKEEALTDDDYVYNRDFGNVYLK